VRSGATPGPGGPKPPAAEDVRAGQLVAGGGQHSGRTTADDALSQGQPARARRTTARRSGGREGNDPVTSLSCQPAASAVSFCSTSSPSMEIWISSLTTIRPSRIIAIVRP
jgi:hypothetical protein